MNQHTPLHSAHVAAGARMVDFGGWDMPINYGSQIEEHHAVRQGAGMFDVSHMTVVDLQGNQARGFLARLLANDVSKLQDAGKALYSCMLNEEGGVIDDLITYYLREDWFRLVVNASTREKDLKWIREQALGLSDLVVRERDDLSMIAVQGPKARRLTQGVLDTDQSKLTEALKPFNAIALDQETGLFVARTGYTGEDGFEIAVSSQEAEDLWNRLAAASVRPCGLGARDTLRLEAGMNLYGQDMDESVTPLESGLAWTVALGGDRDFIGRGALEQQKADGVPHRFVGLVLEERGVLRHGQTVLAPEGDGLVTSGSWSPTLERAIALARLPAGDSSECEVDIRGRRLAARIVKPPFVRQGAVCEGIL